MSAIVLVLDANGVEVDRITIRGERNAIAQAKAETAWYQREADDAGVSFRVIVESRGDRLFNAIITPSTR